MADLKALGSRNALQSRSRGLTGKNRFRQMLQAYENFRQDGSLPATYEIVYGHAWIPAEKFDKPVASKSFPLPVVKG